MGRRAGPCGFPSWTETVGSMKGTRDEKPDHFAVQVGCDLCKVRRDADLDGLIAARGVTFSLINKRYRCRLTKGCRGWNRFFYQSGVMRPLWDERTTERWFAADYAEQQREEAARRNLADHLRGRKWRSDPAPDGVMDDVWGIANDTERHWFTETAAAVRKWKKS
jgi:hypothetical protein